MNNYQCKKCSTHLKSDRRPSTFDCPNGGSHKWTDLGKVGDENYQCKKCALLLQSKGRPRTFDCPSGSSHKWSKL